MLVIKPIRPTLNIKYDHYELVKNKLKENKDKIKQIMLIIFKGINNGKDVEQIIKELKKIDTTEFKEYTDKYIFDDANTKKLINKIKSSDIIKKICIYNDCNYVDITISNGGAYNLSNNYKQDKYNVSKKFRSEILTCFNGKCILSSNSNCNDCDKWIKDNDKFRDKFISFINKKNDNIIEFINDNIYYLPILILDQENYHKFFSLYREYNEQRK
jgi:hypothetical protein